jgi:hypothetical protein
MLPQPQTRIHAVTFRHIDSFACVSPSQDHMIQVLMRFPHLIAEAEDYNTQTSEGILSCVRLHGTVAMQFNQVPSHPLPNPRSMILASAAPPFELLLL